jgi:putative phosphoesterase
VQEIGVMRVAALYDIHGNHQALQAVLKDVRRVGVDRIVIGGDVVPGPMPRETFTELLDLDIPTDFIRGNGDRSVLEHLAGVDTGSVPEAFRPVIRWNAEQMGARHALEMSRWPATLRLEIEPLGFVLFCHATPRSDTEIFTRRTAEEALRTVFGDTPPIVVCGHTHMQFDRPVGSVRVVNAGSVGMPFGDPGAYWLLLDGDVQLRRTDYDLQAAARRIRQSGYPQAESFAAANVLSCPGEEQMLALYAGVQLR